MIDAGQSFVGSYQSVDARRGYPARVVELTLGESRKYVRGEYVDGGRTVHAMSAATARKLAKCLIAEARIIEAGAKGR